MTLKIRENLSAASLKPKFIGSSKNVWAELLIELTESWRHDFKLFFAVIIINC